MFYIWVMVYFTFGLWCNHVCNRDKILFNHTIYYISVFSVFIYCNIHKHMRGYNRRVHNTTHRANLYNLSTLVAVRILQLSYCLIFYQDRPKTWPLVTRIQIVQQKQWLHKGCVIVQMAATV